MGPGYPVPPRVLPNAVFGRGTRPSDPQRLPDGYEGPPRGYGTVMFLPGDHANPAIAMIRTELGEQ